MPTAKRAFHLAVARLLPACAVVAPSALITLNGPCHARHLITALPGTNGPHGCSVECPCSRSLVRSAAAFRTLVGGVMHMRPVTDLLLPAHGELRFAPESLHLMLLGLKSPLVAGEHVPLVLTFKSGVHVSADAVVRGLSEGAPSE